MLTDLSVRFLGEIIDSHIPSCGPAAVAKVTDSTLNYLPASLAGSIVTRVTLVFELHNISC